MSFEDLRRRAAAVRGIPLSDVFCRWGAVRDRHDPRQWQTEVGPISVTGSKFINWHRETGGGGAIDLVMHLGRMTYADSVAWLEQHLGGHVVAGGHAVEVSAGRLPVSVSSEDRLARRILRLPVASDRHLARVRRYLMDDRCLSSSLLEPLLATGKVYADERGNAVFLMVAGKANRPIGAELRGTSDRVWRGMAPGSRRDSGYFWVGTRARSRIVLCESAIDALSCFQLRGDCICISTAGVRSDARWLGGLLATGLEIYCGFDADVAGDASAAAMMARHRSIQRLRPPAHDWNEVLRGGGF